MIKKIFGGAVIAAIVLGTFGIGQASIASAQEKFLTNAQLIETLISLGIIPADKVAAARAVIARAEPPVEPPAVTASASAKLVSTPTLELLYDSKGGLKSRSAQESLLSAQASVSVTAGNKDDFRLFADFYEINFLNAKNVKVGVNSYKTKTMAVTRGVKEDSDSYGRRYFVIPAGKTAEFALVATVDPRALFAGGYYVTIPSLTYTNAEVSGPSTEVLQVSVPKGVSSKSDTKIVVGEISPYITSVTPSVSAGQEVVIQGQRLQGGIISIDGSVPAGIAYKDGNGTSLRFNLPSSVSAGNHAISVRNSTTGDSNRAWFNVISGSNTSTSTTPIISADVSLIGTPSIALTYDSSKKESSLTATFEATVTAGGSDISLFTGFADAYFVDQNKAGYSVRSNRVQIAVPAGEKNDVYGRNYTIIGAGKSLRIKLYVTVDPKELFAGTYRASFGGLYLVDRNNAGGSLPLAVSRTYTDSKTVVGELSPYLTYVTPSVATGQTVSIQGQRLQGGIILIDGVLRTDLAYKDGNGLSLEFQLPSSVSVGNHYVSVRNSTTGDSNNVWFTVGSIVTPSNGGATTTSSPMPPSQLVDLFISLGIISSDKAEAARSAAVSTSGTLTLAQFVDLLISLGIISPEKAVVARSAVTPAFVGTTTPTTVTSVGAGAAFLSLQGIVNWVTSIVK